jgi:hypothetical protein
MGQLVPTAGIIWWGIAAFAHAKWRPLKAEEVLGLWLCWILAGMFSKPPEDELDTTLDEKTPARLQAIIAGHNRRIAELEQAVTRCTDADPRLQEALAKARANPQKRLQAAALLIKNRNTKENCEHELAMQHAHKAGHEAKLLVRVGQ